MVRLSLYYVAMRPSSLDDGSLDVDVFLPHEALSDV
jgi:hypothetical protein